MVHAGGGGGRGDRYPGRPGSALPEGKRGEAEGAAGSAESSREWEQMSAAAPAAPPGEAPVPAAAPRPPGEGSRWSGMIAVGRWLSGYDRTWFRADLAAGVTLAAYLLPAALGDASLAGLPSEAGL